MVTKTKTGNILITSISSKVPLIKAVTEARDKYDKNILIYGADIEDNVIGKYFVDQFWQMPRLANLTTDNLIDYLKKHNISYIVPTRDEDLIYYSQHKSLFLENNIFVFVSDYDSVRICFDKLKFYEDTNSEFVIPTYTKLSGLDTKKNFVLKERFGAGASKIKINISYQDVLDSLNQFDSPVVQPFIQGEEYSIDSYVTRRGVCVASVIRSRDLVINGESKITTRVVDQKLASLCKSFLEQNKILGHSVLQVIKDDDSYHFIECNSRFGGASTLSVKLGLESFLWFLEETNNKEITVNLSDKIIKQVRISKDIYYEC
ncbi:ATP-grasp domain-containing protein [Francisella sp. 19X1-34]|uniref:ATP-grasp domain-containing protein n=1 Tax=Francisella sp. 19X1-34 TaxID=3087177 RepID=UPI002E375A4F|nr:ATP-grasp domain-containing protein [Francisella sp. 19X1-34]MED7787532.1 ATP-grasp domain-containing protein [Francisella sp. 19X1-34]